MASVSKTFEARLKAAGAWELFQRTLADLVASGLSEQRAQVEATRRFRDDAEKGRLVLEAKRAARQEAVEAAARAAELERQREADKAAEKARQETLGPSPSDVADLPPLMDFGGRTAAEAEIVRWVARFMEVQDVKPADCPDPMAWGLLVHCRSNPQAKADFWKYTFPKLLPTRGQLGEKREDEGEYDGKVQVETIDRLLALGRETLAAAGGVS